MAASQNRDVVSFTILVGSGATMSDAQQLPPELHVVDIQIENSLNKIPVATLTIADGNPYEQEFEVGSSGLMAPGKFIEIKIGYNGEDTTVFKGLVIANSHQIAGSQSSLLVTCKHDAVRMTSGKKSRHYADMKDSDVAEQLLAENDIGDFEITATETVHEQLLQNQVSDWDFMLSRLDVNGLCYLANGGKTVIKKCGEDEEPILTLTYGENIVTFDATVDARSQSLGVVGYAWDHSQQDVEASEAQVQASSYAGAQSNEELAAVMNQPFEMRVSGAMPVQSLQLLANAKQTRQSLAKIRGKVKFSGDATIIPGVFVTLAGVGSQFNGKVFVSGVRHEFGEGNWMTEAILGWEEDFFSEKIFPDHPVALTGQYVATHGLQVGLVTDLSDPLGQGRIRIRVPVISTSDDGLYARLATLDAGDGRGTFFMPEVGDEVIIGFLGDDPNYPVVLGMLHSAAKVPPLEATDQNDEKGYISRSKIKILIHDGDKKITIETPGGRMMTLDDANGICTMEDAAGNKLLMDDSGITLSAAKDLVLKAVSSLSLSAPQVEIKADATLKLSGTGSLSVASSGITEIKGSIVKIN